MILEESQSYVKLLKDFLKDPEIAFRMFDKDRNNTLNLAKLRRALTHLGEPLSEKEAMELCNMMDVNGDQKCLTCLPGKEGAYSSALFFHQLRYDIYFEKKKG
ncbi:hypothetical protein DPMN_071062, partial [Dreissena polymorpha]